MYINNRAAPLVWRCMLLAAGGAGLYMNIYSRQGGFYPAALIYYTILSNLACFFYFLTLTFFTAARIFRKGVRGEAAWLPRLKGALTMCITVTLLVYHFLLAGGAPPIPPAVITERWAANFLLHYVTPTMVILDWALFSPKKTFRRLDPLLWLAIPLAYVCFALVRAEIGGLLAGGASRFPYFFLDIDAIGWAGMLGYSAVITLGCVVLGYIYFFLDNYLLYKKGERERE
jgi:hypothetical protein